ncbi:nucleoside 2-deoxyribosyltransferase [Stackebrandtia endophytica]|nr:nucleoside 2-deoxyribosyltransferase [Stackebrandtia endophytica]
MDFEAGSVVPQWRERLERLRSAFLAAGSEVFNAHHNERWGEQWLAPEVCTPADFAAMTRCDVVCALIGRPPSGGVAVELGWASALSKPVVLLVDPIAGASPLITGLGAVTRTEYADEPTQWSDVELRAIVKQTLWMVNGAVPTDDADTGVATNLAGLDISEHVRFCTIDRCGHESATATI